MLVFQVKERAYIYHSSKWDEKPFINTDLPINCPACGGNSPTSDLSVPLSYPGSNLFHILDLAQLRLHGDSAKLGKFEAWETTACQFT